MIWADLIDVIRGYFDGCRPCFRREAWWNIVGALNSRLLNLKEFQFFLFLE